MQVSSFLGPAAELNTNIFILLSSLPYHFTASYRWLHNPKAGIDTDWILRCVVINEETIFKQKLTSL